MTIKKLYIFDFDGTLSDPSHRRHILDTDDEDKWKKFFLACGADSPNESVIHTLNSLANMGDCDILIFSGRSDIARAISVEWLNQHTELHFYPDDERLIMRREGDFTPDHILKKQWLDNMLIEDRARLVAVFDDRDSVVRMWRENGITCYQVNYGDF